MLDLQCSLLRQRVITVCEKGPEFDKNIKSCLWNSNPNFILHPTLNVFELVFKQGQIFQLPEWILFKKHKYWETNPIIVVVDDCQQNESSRVCQQKRDWNSAPSIIHDSLKKLQDILGIRIKYRLYHNRQIRDRENTCNRVHNSNTVQSCRFCFLSVVSRLLNALTE